MRKSRTWKQRSTSTSSILRSCLRWQKVSEITRKKKKRKIYIFTRLYITSFTRQRKYIFLISNVSSYRTYFYLHKSNLSSWWTMQKYLLTDWSSRKTILLNRQIFEQTLNKKKMKKKKTKGELFQQSWLLVQIA